MSEQRIILSTAMLVQCLRYRVNRQSWLFKLLLVCFLSSGVMNSAAQPGIGDNGGQTKQGLSAAIQATMRYHPAIKGKQAELDASNSLVSSAKAGRYPDLSGQAQTLNNGENTGTLRLRQPLWAFGRIDSAIDQAQAQTVVEHQQFLKVKRELIEDVAVAYAQVRGLTVRVHISENNVQAHERLRQQIEARQQGQLASVADVRLATSRLLRAQGDYQRLMGERETALTQLQRLTQIEVSTELRLLDEQLILPPDIQVQRLAMANNVDVLVKQAQAKVAHWNIKNTQLADAPTLYFQIDQEILDSPHGRDRTQASLVFEARTEGIGFTSRGRSKSARSRYQAAKFDVDSAKNDVRRKLDILLLSRSLQRRLRVSQTSAVAAVEDTLASFIRQYQSGRKSWLDVLNTQREVTQMKQQLALINHEWNTSTLRIAVLIGGFDHLAGVNLE